MVQVYTCTRQEDVQSSDYWVTWLYVEGSLLPLRILVEAPVAALTQYTNNKLQYTCLAILIGNTKFSGSAWNNNKTNNKNVPETPKEVVGYLSASSHGSMDPTV